MTQQKHADRAAITVRGTPGERAGRKGSTAEGNEQAPGPLMIEILGPLRVTRGRATLELGPTKQRELLVLLALQPNEVVGRRELVDALWGDRPPASVATLVHTCVSRLRRLLEPRRERRAPGQIIVAANGGYRLEVSADQLDLLRFDELHRAADASAGERPDAALELYEQALECWRGPIAADANRRLHEHPAVTALNRRRLAALLSYADLAIANRRPEAAERRLTAVLHDEPLHEGLHARLMLALAGSGQQAAALHLFHEIRGRLSDELGIEPGPELRAAQLRVLRGEVSPAEAGSIAGSDDPESGAAAVEPAVRTPPAQLPADIAGFTGRTRYLERLDALLDTGGSTSATIAAIVGTAGVGKTALAVRWAHRIRDAFVDGQLYVDLRGYAQEQPLRPIEVLTLFLRALGTPPERVPVDLDEAAGLYRTLLATRKVLVLLDNASGPAQVRPLLCGSPNCLVIVTSRNRLTDLVAREGAARLTLEVLSPDEALALFSAALGEERTLRESVAAAEPAELCAYLPLALRIAAANVANDPRRSIQDYLADLRRGNRLAVLEVDGDEQAALRAAFDLSLSDLPEQTRELFLLLGLAPGVDFTVDSAASLVASTAPDARRELEQLAAGHLLHKTSAVRYAFHDLMRLYAVERAQQDVPAAVRDASIRRLYDWYLRRVDGAARVLYPDVLRLALTETSKQDIEGEFAEPSQALEWLDAEHSNLVSVVQKAADNGLGPHAYQLADALRCYFWLRSRPVDWLAVTQAGLAAAEADKNLKAQAAAHLSLADAYFRLSRYDDAVRRYERGVVVARQSGWLQGEAGGLNGYGMVLARYGRLDEAAQKYIQALAINRLAGSVSGQANNLNSVASLYYHQGRLTEAAAHLTQALALYEQTGARHRQAVCLRNLGETCHDLGRLGDARAYLDRAITLAQAVGDRGTEAEVMRCLAAIERDVGQEEYALTLATVALDLARGLDDRRVETDALNTRAGISLRLGQRGKALDQYREALELAEASGDQYILVETLVGLAECRCTLADAQQAMEIASAAGFQVLEGMALTTSARLYLHASLPERAVVDARQAVSIQAQTGRRLQHARALRVLGDALAAVDGRPCAEPIWRAAMQTFGDTGEMGVREAAELAGMLHTRASRRAEVSL